MNDFNWGIEGNDDVRGLETFDEVASVGNEGDFGKEVESVLLSN